MFQVKHAIFAPDKFHPLDYERYVEAALGRRVNDEDRAVIWEEARKIAETLKDITNESEWFSVFELEFAALNWSNLTTKQGE